jgi:peptide chain release factor subunit 1
VAVITADEIRELASFRSADAPVTTCYLDVDGSRFVRPTDVEAELERVLRGARATWGDDGSVTDDLKRIEDHVRAGFDRSHVRGLAIFTCAAEHLWRVVPLPVRVTSSVSVNEAPAVGQLERVVQELARFGVLLADKQRARMFVFEVAELTDHSELFEALPRDYDHRGHGDQGYDREQHHVEELTHQHLRHAAQVAFHVHQDTGFEHLVIGAPDAIARELESCLHPYLKDRLRGRIGVAVGASIEDIRRAAVDVEQRIERETESAAVDRLRDAVGAGGRAVAGLAPVLTALHERRAGQVLVSAGFAESGWRCGSCGALATVGRTCPSCSAQMSHLDDVVEDAVEEALSQGIKVDIVVGNADLDVLGRIGAFLRY